MSPTRTCTTYAGLKQAVKDKADRIEIRDKVLARKVLLVMNVDKAVLLGALGAIGYAVANLTTTVAIPVEIATNGGASSVVRFGSSGAVIAWLVFTVGWAPAHAIIAVAVGLGGMGAFTMLFKSYSVDDWSVNHVVLERR